MLRMFGKGNIRKHFSFHFHTHAQRETDRQTQMNKKPLSSVKQLPGIEP